MHQPLYKDRLSGLYLLPWVRLHAIKDYLDMPLLLKEYPKIRQTFNLVPSLIEQLEDYAYNKAVDEQILLTEKDESTYTADDKVHILRESFHVNFERQVARHRVYLDLYMRRQRLLKHGHTFQSIAASHEFSDQDYADMATWFNLAWFDPSWFERVPELKTLLGQGRNYNQKQRKQIIENQRQIIKSTVKVYKDLQEKGCLEVTTSPYYHPILPLLIDSETAKTSYPFTKLPERPFLHKEDAEAQIKQGLSFAEDKLGRRPKGMWPSELAISSQALELIAQQGVQWVVLDEGILTRSRPNTYVARDEHGNLNSVDLICQPYRVRAGKQEISVIFRELVISNEISFSYGSRAPEEAAHALYMRLKHIQEKTQKLKREGIVAIALDGENCWETYELDGNPFLHHLYALLCEDETLNVCTVSDYLKRNPATQELKNIHPGSWIRSDFHVWIGDPQKNKAWELLATTRDFYTAQKESGKHSDAVLAKAMEEIYTAEGSDWFWWFGEPNNSEHDQMFDLQFRIRLQNVYKLLGHIYPKELDVPVSELAVAVQPITL